MLISKIWKIYSSKVDPPFKRGLKVIFSPIDDGTINFTLLVSTIYPGGGKAPLHKHEDSGELICIISGRGKGILGDKKFSIEPDMAFYAPPKIMHQVLNTGDETLKILCFFRQHYQKST